MGAIPRQALQRATRAAKGRRSGGDTTRQCAGGGGTSGRTQAPAAGKQRQQKVQQHYQRMQQALKALNQSGAPIMGWPRRWKGTTMPLAPTPP